MLIFTTCAWSLSYPPGLDLPPPLPQPGLCPPSLLESKLAHGCRQLLDSHEHSDMQFVLVPQKSEGGDGGDGGEGGESGRVVIPAHRVIVAARCKWFRRALLSGMKEAIDRCVAVGLVS